jgi:hypothetical protein
MVTFTWNVLSNRWTWISDGSTFIRVSGPILTSAVRVLSAVCVSPGTMLASAFRVYVPYDTPVVSLLVSVAEVVEEAIKDFWKT